MRRGLNSVYEGNVNTTSDKPPAIIRYKTVTLSQRTLNFMIRIAVNYPVMYTVHNSQFSKFSAISQQLEQTNMYFIKTIRKHCKLFEQF